MEDIGFEDFAGQMQTNYFDVVHASKAAVPLLRRQGFGHIIQIASIGARLATVGLAAYQSAKFAVRGISLALNQEVAPLRLQVTVVQRGGMRTDWAGPPTGKPVVSPPYEQTVGVFAERLRQAAGHESSDPRKVADVIMKLANRQDAPAELLVGEDAVEYVERATKAGAVFDRQWRNVSISTRAD